jgi:hypothetical protein
MYEAEAKLREAIVTVKGQNISSGLADTLADAADSLAFYSAEMHDAEGSAAAYLEYQHYTKVSLRDTPGEQFASLIAKDQQAVEGLGMNMLLGRPAAPIREQLQPIIARVESLSPGDAASQRIKQVLLANAYSTLQQAALDLGQFEDAEHDSKKWSDFYVIRGIKNLQDRANYGFAENQRAKAIAAQGRYADARAVIDPQVKFFRGALASAPEDQLRVFNLALVLATQAASQERSERQKRIQLLDEAQHLMDGLPPGFRSCEDPQYVLRYIAAQRSELEAGK